MEEVSEFELRWMCMRVTSGTMLGLTSFVMCDGQRVRGAV